MNTRTAARNINVSFSNSLYTSGKIANKDRLCDALILRKPIRNHYLITLGKENELFRVYSLTELLQPFYDDESFNVVGIAKGYFNTKKLLLKIIDDIYTDTGAFDVGHYFYP